MNIFASLRVYAGKWAEKSHRDFTPEEIASVLEANVIESEYGNSVCFIMRTGGQTYIPVDQNSSLSLGDSVDLSKHQLVTLERAGEDDIYRVR